MKSSQESFAAANDILRGFLRRLADGKSTVESVSEGDLRSVAEQISNPVSEVGEASRSATLDGYLQNEIGEYVRNFRTLQETLEKVRFLLVARRLIGAR